MFFEKKHLILEIWLKNIGGINLVNMYSKFLYDRKSEIWGEK